MRASPHELEELLAHGPWVRELARSLVRDPSRADDLAQQAWLKTLERPPAPRSSPRGWFATVLRNLAREEHRADLRRAAREQLAATRGTEALGVTLELSTQLAQALAGLAEPYRSAIFRRYYEGLAPRRIAAQDGIPLKTVKTRLARGLEQLRERLDREHDGDRGAWVMACAPLLRGSATPPILGGIIMNAKLACALAGLVLLGAWAVMHGTHSDRPQPSAALERDLARDPSAHRSEHLHGRLTRECAPERRGDEDRDPARPLPHGSATAGTPGAHRRSGRTGSRRCAAHLRHAPGGAGAAPNRGEQRRTCDRCHERSGRSIPIEGSSEGRGATG